MFSFFTKRSTLSFAFAASLLVGCGDKETANDPNVLINNDFENLVGWIPDSPNPSITKEKAHSGKYSIKVDANNEYSLTYTLPLGKMRETRVKKFTISAWAFVPAQGKASLVAVVTRPSAPADKPQLYQILEMDKSKTFGKWVEVSQEVTMPEGVAPSDVLRIYLWRTGGTQPVYLDDLKVTLDS